MFISSFPKFLSLCTTPVGSQVTQPGVASWMLSQFSKQRGRPVSNPGSASFFCEGQDSKYVRVCRTEVDKIWLVVCKITDILIISRKIFFSKQGHIHKYHNWDFNSLTEKGIGLLRCSGRHTPDTPLPLRSLHGMETDKHINRRVSDTDKHN